MKVIKQEATPKHYVKICVDVTGGKVRKRTRSRRRKVNTDSTRM